MAHMASSSSLALHGLASQAIRVLDASPTALGRWLQHTRRPWTPAMASFAVQSASGALLLGGAHQILVPASLISYLDGGEVHHESSSSSWMETWRSMQEESSLVVLAEHHEVEHMLQHHSGYHNYCVPLPGGPLISKLAFDRPYDEVCAEEIGRVADIFAVAGPRWRWSAWLRSSLTCKFEGIYVPAIRVAELTAHLLSHTDGGCREVVWEEGSVGLTSRWFETAAKTALACGVPTSSLRCAFANGNRDLPRLLHKSLEVGVHSLATCGLGPSGLSLFEHAEPLMPVDAVADFVAGWNDVGGDAAVDESLDARQDCLDFVHALNEEWLAIRDEEDTKNICSLMQSS